MYVWHASDETEVTILLPHLMPARLGKKLNDGRKNGDLRWLRPEHAGSVHARMMLTSMRVAKTSCSGARVRGLNDAMPLTRLMATRLWMKLTDVRKNGSRASKEGSLPRRQLALDTVSVNNEENLLPPLCTIFRVFFCIVAEQDLSHYIVGLWS